MSRVRMAEILGKVAIALIQWGGLALIALYTFKSVEALSGRHTAADIGIKLLANVTISKGLAYLLGVGGVGYGLRQRGLRRTTVERMHRRVRELEARHDPKRSSSGLTTRGETAPEDE